MLSYEETEAESLENLGKWWKAHGKKVIVAVLGVSALYLSWTFWQSHVKVEQEKASNQFSQFLLVLESEKVDDIEASLKLLRENYGKSVYADMASMLVAKNAVDAADLEEAKHHLRYVIEHSHSSVMLPLAQTRLARLLMQEKAFSDALVVLNTVKQDTGYKTLVEELKGDVFLAQNNWEEAKAAYTRALMAGPESASQRPWLKMKMDNMAMDKKVS